MMSVQEEREAVELPHQGDLAFGALMDALVPAEAGATGNQGAAGAGHDAGTDAGAAPPAVGTGDGTAPIPAVGGNAPAGGQPDAAGQAHAGSPAAAGGDAPGSGGAPAGDPAGADATGVPATWTVDPGVVTPELGTLSTKFEETVSKAYQKVAYEGVREEYGQYFEALEKHPRLLVGATVPAIGKEGNETLRNSEDAKEWQEAVKSLLIAEIREQATVKMEESADYLQTVHASIDLFKNNPDLIPGTKGFNRALADNFAGMMEPYEVRVDGKLQGYSIPVQPIIEKLRAQLKTAAAVPAPAAAPPAAAPVKSRAPEPPQAGIQSKAGSSTEKEDFSTLFGTIGLPNLQI